MKKKQIFIVFILCAVVICLYTISSSYNKLDSVNKVYKVYLDGEMLGTITDEDALYNLIDEKQQVIKDKYNVRNVYPPNGLEIIETYSYDTEITDLTTIYNKIEELQDFTIYGYEISISATNEHEAFNIYVLEKDVFTKAIKEFILAFIDIDGYNDYMNGTQKELDDIGINYKNMQIIEDISIREKYISTNDKVYEDSNELAQDLLFGFNYEEEVYTIKEGDTIESISEENVLNTQEFLIANPKYASEDSLLTIGDKVNITLIDPEIAFEYTIYEMKEVEYDYDKEVVRDTTKPATYSEITTAGVTGLSVQKTHYTVVNGEPNSEIEIDEEIVIREKVNQVTTKGRKEAAWGWQTTEDTGTGWRWPTENPYAVTSEFAPRWGKYHNGIDISGSGWGSRIYAANDGVVTRVVSGCPDNGSYPNSCGSGYGNYVVIQHDNGYYTIYSHMLNKIPVRVGQTISRGTVVGYMGNSGQSKGTHLHFGVSVGDPMSGGSFMNPRKLYK